MLGLTVSVSDTPEGSGRVEGGVLSKVKLVMGKATRSGLGRSSKPSPKAGQYEATRCHGARLPIGVRPP